ncbi:polysaccharide deacetylase family protein [Catalinimonas alkaloidigena]|uniref:polysaccharide deacetylase family protein n=1 Tax=Catalinimonas alkaloidigena TaxID=1075417 RepID=UPI0024052CB7|nr:polysaccharide deacetylase family protein [Catalinimonas alkaloidigena]
MKAVWHYEKFINRMIKIQPKIIVLLLIHCLSAGPVFSQFFKQQIPDKLVVLTFDDAVSTHATYVGPLLKKYGFGATFFVCEFPPDFEDKSKYMSWEQIQKLGEMGFEIANHTHHHTHVNRIDEAELIKELTYIEEKCVALGLEKPITFAYPAYETDEEVITTLKKQGYRLARAGGSLAYDPLIHHPYLIPSFSTTGEDKERVINAIKQAKDGKVVVLTVHGVPDYAHDWVTTPPKLFEIYLKFLHDNNYQVIALKDLEIYIDVDQALNEIQPNFEAVK